MEPSNRTTREELACGCEACRRPFAYVQNGALSIISRHGGDQHTNVYAIIDLARRYLSADDLRLLLAQREVYDDHQQTAA